MAAVPRPVPSVKRLLIGVRLLLGVCVVSAAPGAPDAAREDAEQGAQPRAACPVAEAAEAAEVSLLLTPSAKQSDSAESLLQRSVGRTGSENATLWEEPAEVPSNLTGRRGAAAAPQFRESDPAREHQGARHGTPSCNHWLTRARRDLLGGVARAAGDVSEAVGRRLQGHDAVFQTLFGLALIVVGVVVVAVCARNGGQSFFRDTEAEAEDRPESKSSHILAPFVAPRSPDARYGRLPAQGHASPQAPRAALRRDSASSQAVERPQRNGFAPALGVVSEDKAAQPPLSSHRLPPAALPQAPQLCPDLVVPEGSECTLLAPRLRELPPAAGPPVMLDITDLRHAPVFKVVLNPSRGGAYPVSVVNPVSSSALGSRTSARQGTTRISLESAQDDSVFAFAHDTSMWFHGRPFGLEVCHGNEQAYGQLCASTAEPGIYLMTCRGSGPVRFQRTREPGLEAIRITAEDSGTLLAIAEASRDTLLPQGSDKRSVRIGPKVDAGFVALLIAGIDWLELHAREGPAQAQ